MQPNFNNQNTQQNSYYSSYFNNQYSFNQSFIQQQSFSFTSYNNSYQSTYPNGYLSVNRQWQYTPKYELVGKSEKPTKIPKYDLKAAKKSQKTNVKFCCYNLLAPDLLNNNANLYRHINRNYLDWDYRKQKLMDQFKRLNSDVIYWID